MLTCTCIGACKGDPNWRDPETGLCCTCCFGSGVNIVYTQRELWDKEWDGVRHLLAERAKRAAERRAARRRAAA
jgi:hypothetical protein